MTTSYKQQTSSKLVNPCRTLSKCFGALFDEEKTTDAIFLVGEDVTEVKGHKLVLSTRSPVFDAMFNGGFEDDGRVKIQDTKAEDFHMFIRFLYTDEIDLSMENVIDILYLADKYNVPLLFEKCAQYLAENIKVDNACTAYAAAKAYNAEELKIISLNFICLHAKECLRTDAFLQLNSNDVDDISSSENLACSEEHLFECLDNWAGVKCKEKELGMTDEDRRAVLGKLLYNIRIPLMQYEYIVSNISTRKICTESEMMKILQVHVSKEDNECSDSVAIADSPFSSTARKSLQIESVLVIPKGKYRLQTQKNSGEQRNVKFSVSADNWFYGLIIYGPEEKLRFGIEVVLKDEESNLVLRDHIFLTSDDKMYTCDALLKSPVYLKRAIRYTCWFVIYSSEMSFFYLHDNSLPQGDDGDYEEIGTSKGQSVQSSSSYLVIHRGNVLQSRSGVSSVLHDDSFVAGKTPVNQAKRRLFRKCFNDKTLTLTDRSVLVAGLLLF